MRSGSIALLCISLACSALLAELALRWRFGPPIHYRYPQGRYVSDPEIGVWLAPNQRAFAHDHPLLVNSVGIRGPEYRHEVPPGTRRVLAIGDSQTFGNGLALADSWPAQLEVALNRAGTKRWQVLNGGLPGTDTWQHALVLDRLAEAYEFDAVLLGFYVNDVVPHRHPGPAEGRTNTWTKRLGYVAKRSALLALLWQTYQGYCSQRSVGIRELHIVDGEPDPAVEEGWAEVERSLARMRDRARELAASFSLVVIPRRDQVGGREPGTAYNERIAEITRRLGIPLIDVLPALRDAYRQHGEELFIPWDGHNSALANSVIAEQLAASGLAGVDSN